MGDTSYRVAFEWSGSDPDGSAEYFEIAWESPEDWQGPISSQGSVFIVSVAEAAGGPLSFPDASPDSVYERLHTFFVRAVDNDGLPDPTPAFRTFNATTIAPRTEITFGPSNGGNSSRGSTP
jgi:hypothetical protein